MPTSDTGNAAAGQPQKGKLGKVVDETHLASLGHDYDTCLGIPRVATHKLDGPTDVIDATNLTNQMNVMGDLTGLGKQANPYTKEISRNTTFTTLNGGLKHFLRIL
jgi:hypothetical protein